MSSRDGVSVDDLRSIYRAVDWRRRGDSFDIQTPIADIRFGAGRRTEVPRAVEALCGERVFLIGTPSAAERFADVWESIRSKTTGAFWQARPHCPIETVEACRSAFSAARADTAVAIGGGSTLGLGKILAAEEGATFIALPTTYTGSEVNPIYGRKTRTEKAIRTNVRCLPHAVIYDPALSCGLPADVTAATGMNSLAHAIEALYPPKDDPICFEIARAAIAALRDGLPAAVRTPRDVRARISAAYGGWLSGVAIALSGIALHHQLCHVLGGLYGGAHGAFNSVILPHVVAYNAQAAPKAARAIMEILEADDAAQAVYAFARTLGAPASLSELGVPSDCVEAAPEHLLRHGTVNPRPLEKRALSALLAAAYAGLPPGSAMKREATDI